MRFNYAWPGRGARRATLVLLGLGGSLGVAACGGSTPGQITALSAQRPALWTPTAHVRRILDVVTRGNGPIVLAAAGRLGLLAGAPATIRPLGSGSGRYLSPGGEEPYVALAPTTVSNGQGCRFDRAAIYAMRLGKGAGVTVVDAQGRERRFASLGDRGLENGIAFDDTGRFGHRLLVTATAGAKTTVSAIDCHAHVAIITRDAPRLEGGIAVAPANFGHYSGDLIAADENTGAIYAIAPDGTSRLLAQSGLPRGGDVGVESLGFVPARFGAGWSALVADRVTPGNPHPGDDVLLAIVARSLVRAGVRPGDLLFTTEGGALTDAVTCAAACRVRHVADGPAGAHVEGHIAFTARG